VVTKIKVFKPCKFGKNMKMLHFTDVHDGIQELEAVRDFAKERKDLDAVMCTGDLLSATMLDNDDLGTMLNSWAFLRASIPIEKPIPAQEFACGVRRGIIANAGRIDERIIRASDNYARIEEKFDEALKTHYGSLRDIIKGFPQRVLMIPGNWDTVNFDEYFGEFNIHGEIVDVSGTRVAGYGRYNFIPNVVPPTRVDESYDPRELYNFLVDADPQIALTHAPPYGILDGTNQTQRLGDFAILSYMLRESPVLLLCGHKHNFIGKEQPEYARTVVVNSGNLGKYPEEPQHGTFSEIELEGEDVKNVLFYIVQDGKVQEYKGNGSASS